MDQHDVDQQYLLQTLMNTISDVIYFKDLESRFILVNEAFLHKHGMQSAEEVVGKTDFDLFDPVHAEEARADEQQVMEAGKPSPPLEEKELWPDGRVTWALTVKAPLRDESGRIVGTFGIGRDITVRKESRLLAARYAKDAAAIKDLMEEEAGMAGRLLKTFMPQKYPVFAPDKATGKPCLEFLHRVHQSRAVSGDYCAVYGLSDHKAGLFLCDVRGVGVRAALGTALIRGIMQELEGLRHDPGALLEHLNERLFPLLQNDGPLLKISSCYLTVDAASRTVCSANAGHPVPIHIQHGALSRPLCENLVWRGPLLAEETGNRYRNHETRLDPGDAVLLFSTGVSNARNALDEPFGERRVTYETGCCTDAPLEQLFNWLDRAVLSFTGRTRFEDDVCLAACRFNGSPGA